MLLKNNVKNRDPEYVPLGFNFFGSPYSKKKGKETSLPQVFQG